jgi:DNA-directed RNA polymerase specialized sigma24 family protein
MTIKPVRYHKTSRRQNCGASIRQPVIDLSNHGLSAPEKRLIQLIQDLGWSYSALGREIGVSKQAVHTAVKKIVNRQNS